MLIYTFETKNWANSKNSKLLLLQHRLIKVSIMFLVPLMIRGVKEKGRVRIEAEVAMLTEGVTTPVTIRVVTRRLPTRDLLDKVIIIQVSKGVRVIANPPNILTRTNKVDTISSTKTRTES